MLDNDAAAARVPGHRRSPASVSALFGGNSVELWTVARWLVCNFVIVLPSVRGPPVSIPNKAITNNNTLHYCIVPVSHPETSTNFRQCSWASNLTFETKLSESVNMLVIIALR